MTTSRSASRVGTDAKLTRIPLGRQIADVVRNDILYGRLPAGTHVGQQVLCERYGTSRMPVRDALQQLTYEGFVQDDGTGHSIVAPMTRADLQDAYLIEGMLHGLSVRRITERGEKGEIKELLGYHEQMLEAERQKSVDQMASLNWQFHRRINQLARSNKLLAAIRTHALYIPNDQLRQFPQWTERVNLEHAEIIDAASGRRAATAERLMKQHVINAGNDLIDYLESIGVVLQ